MARITTYSNSILASIFSMGGSILIIPAVMLFLDGDIQEAIVLALLAFGLMRVASVISNRKAFKTWWKQVEKNGLIPEIRKSRDVAVNVYQKNPKPETLKKIRELNPDAAAYIQNGFKEPASGRQTAVRQQPVQKPAQQPVRQTPVVQQPAQQPVRQTPVVQQPVYQSPVVQQPTYQPPVMQQPMYQPPVYSRASSAEKTLDQQIDELERINTANVNGQRDPQIYWQCAQRAEELLKIYPNNEYLMTALAQYLRNYSWTSGGKPFEERRRAYHAALRSLTLEKQKREFEEMDKRKFCLVIHAVNGGMDAVNLDDIDAMEEAIQWLRTAGNYRAESPGAEQQQYENVSVPSVRFYVGYWLAKAYLAQNPPQKQKAKAVLEEALQACPYALIRQCDLSPKLNTNTDTVITREQMMELLQLAST